MSPIRSSIRWNIDCNFEEYRISFRPQRGTARRFLKVVYSQNIVAFAKVPPLIILSWHTLEFSG